MLVVFLERWHPRREQSRLATALPSHNQKHQSLKELSLVKLVDRERQPLPQAQLVYQQQL